MSRTLLEYSRKFAFQLFFSTSLLALPCTHPACLACFLGGALLHNAVIFYLFFFPLSNFSCCLESFPPFSSKRKPSGTLFGMFPAGFGQEQAQWRHPASSSPPTPGCLVGAEQRLLFLPSPHPVFVAGESQHLLQLLVNSHPYFSSSCRLKLGLRKRSH